MDSLTIPHPHRATKAPVTSRPPEFALQDDMRVGNCWKTDTRNAQLAVVLPQLVYPTHITVDHIPTEIAANVGEAPKNMLVWGVIDGKLNRARYLNLLSSDEPIPSADGRFAPPHAGGYSYVLLSTFQYDLAAPSHVQTFPVDPRIVKSRMYFGIVVFEIVDNWGSPTTCLYRVRVHGDPVDL
ncbi:Sad1/UNC-like protein [Trametes coccinea BRFM310]|uniref:Sad1/UNC-like protein n=1 Tax=Trametes coccinea (strain BRFM310) TaxID=1353009 RepID=A0A1Y2I5L4_TRAC3|nr:Sad1/UNC-like protein [Trametes coccinea BRFM310]